MNHKNEPLTNCIKASAQGLMPLKANAPVRPTRLADLKQIFHVCFCLRRAVVQFLESLRLELARKNFSSRLD